MLTLADLEKKVPSLLKTEEQLTKIGLISVNVRKISRNVTV